MSKRSKRSKFRPHPGRGQNFLVDQNYIQRIIDSAELATYDEVLEIGPGFGALTIPLSKKVKKLFAVEWDTRLVGYINKRLRYDSERVKILHADIMKIDILKALEAFSNPPVIIGNLPYYLSTSIIVKIIPFGAKMIKKMIFMVQKEVAERIVAQPSTKAYGSLSLTIKYFAEAEALFRVPPNAFKPKPKVESEIIILKPRENPPVKLINKDIFFRIIKSSFLHRRKTLVNAIKLDPFFKSFNIEKICENLGMEKNIRAEALTLDDFARMSNNIRT